MHSRDSWEKASQIAYLTICGLAVTFWPQNLISSSLCRTNVLNLWNSYTQFTWSCVSNLLIHDHRCTHAHTDMMTKWTCVIENCMTTRCILCTFYIETTEMLMCQIFKKNIACMAEMSTCENLHVSNNRMCMCHPQTVTTLTTTSLTVDYCTSLFMSEMRGIIAEANYWRHSRHWEKHRTGNHKIVDVIFTANITSAWVLKTRAVLNIRFVFAPAPNSGPSE